MHYPTETLSLSNYAAYFLLLFYIPLHRLISFAITYIFILQQTGLANRGKYGMVFKNDKILL